MGSMSGWVHGTWNLWMIIDCHVRWDDLSPEQANCTFGIAEFLDLPISWYSEGMQCFGFISVCRQKGGEASVQLGPLTELISVTGLPTLMELLQIAFLCTVLLHVNLTFKFTLGAQIVVCTYHLSVWIDVDQTQYTTLLPCVWLTHFNTQMTDRCDM